MSQNTQKQRLCHLGVKAFSKVSLTSHYFGIVIRVSRHSNEVPARSLQFMQMTEGIITSTAALTFVADPVDLPSHRATGLFGGLHAGVHGRAADHVDAGDGELVLLGVVQQVHQGLTSDVDLLCC